MEEESHPGVESLIQASRYKFIVNSICPRYRSETEIEYFQDDLPSMCCNLIIGESWKESWQNLGHKWVKLFHGLLIVNQRDEVAESANTQVDSIEVSTAAI